MSDMPRCCYNEDGVPKARYRTKREAKHAVTKFMQHGKVLKPYHCWRCDWYHLCTPKRGLREAS